MSLNPLQSPCVSILTALLMAAPASSQATFVVDALGDSVDVLPGDGLCLDAAGECTLRAALMESNALPGHDLIVLPAGTVVLDRVGLSENLGLVGDLDVLDSVTIRGQGAGLTTIDAGALADRALQLGTGLTVRFEDLSIIDGEALGASWPSSVGGLVLCGASDTTFLRCTLQGGRTVGGGGAVWTFGGSLTLEECEVSGNATQPNNGGGGVGAYSTTSVCVTNCVFSDNDAGPNGRGGAMICNPNSSTVITGTTFVRNDGGLGTAVFVAGGTTRIEDCELRDNGQVVGGGPLYLQSTASELRRCWFEGNRTTWSAMVVCWDDDALIDGCTFTRNDATGAISANGFSPGTVTVSDCVISDNVRTSTFRWGWLSGGSFVVSRTPITDNLDNAVARCAGSLEDCEVAGNTSPFNSLVFVPPGQSLSLYRCQLRGNGGSPIATVEAAGHAVLEDCVVEGNTSQQAALITRSDPGARLDVRRTCVSGNSASWAGAVYAGVGETFLEDCAFSANTALAPFGGGALSATNGASIAAVNCTLTGNASAGGGGGVSVAGSGAVELDLCTVAGNETAAGVGGVKNDGTFTARNSIVALNVGSLANDVAGSGAWVSAGYNLVGDVGAVLWPAGFGDQTGTTASPLDPGFAPSQMSAGGCVLYPLSPTSPAIDAGDGAGAPATDAAGEPRVVDGDGDGDAAVDLGALEFQPTGAAAVAAATRAVCDRIANLDLALFSGPNQNSNEGRRTSMTVRCANAVDRIEGGQYPAASALLSSILQQADGIPMPKDWLHPGPVQVSLAGDLQALLGQLAAL